MSKHILARSITVTRVQAEAAGHLLRASNQAAKRSITHAAASAALSDADAYALGGMCAAGVAGGLAAYWAHRNATRRKKRKYMPYAVAALVWVVVCALGGAGRGGDNEDDGDYPGGGGGGGHDEDKDDSIGNYGGVVGSAGHDMTDKTSENVQDGDGDDETKLQSAFDDAYEDISSPTEPAYSDDAQQDQVNSGACTVHSLPTSHNPFSYADDAADGVLSNQILSSGRTSPAVNDSEAGPSTLQSRPPLAGSSSPSSLRVRILPSSSPSQPTEFSPFTEFSLGSPNSLSSPGVLADAESLDELLRALPESETSTGSSNGEDVEDGSDAGSDGS